MNNKLEKVLPVEISEIRDSVFSHNAQIKLQLAELVVWFVVHRDLIKEGVIFIKVLGELDDYYDVAIPGEILRGSRVVRINKKGHLQWYYRIKPSYQSSRGKTFS
ncbi:MAG TPA: hypothetical protein EYP60_08385 [bacterium (Candidatus Stahlbacteria)]|nr:hypothetical protein [Candidatus Stahlbacteria bacterium]